MDRTNLLSSLIPAATGLIGLILGAVITHVLARRREMSQKIRDFKLNYLIDAWRNVYVGSQSHIEIEQKAPAFEHGIIDIMLFGSTKQIEMARTIAQEIVAKGSSDTTGILNDLRDDIRSELGIEKTSSQPFFFSLTQKSSPVSELS